MASAGKGRMVGVMTALARLAMAAGIGCMVFTAAMVLVLSGDAPLASPEIAAGLGMLGAMWVAAGFVAERLLRLIAARPAEPAAAATPSWHNQVVGRDGRQSRPARAAARQPQPLGWWTVLGVPADAAPATFESAARGLLRQSHPDRWATADPVRRQEAEGRTRIILQALADARAAAR